jgi:hypothetical protein
MQLAQPIAAQRERHRWFQDELTLGKEHEPQFGDIEIDEARTLRCLLCRDLAYDSETLPVLQRLPELARIIAAHAELRRVDEIETAARAGEIPYMNPDVDTARPLRDWVVAFDSFMREIANERWLLDVYHLLLGVKALDPAPLSALKEALIQWTDLHRRGRDFELRALACDHSDDVAFDRALEDLAAGRKPFGMFSMFRGGIKAKIESTFIEGRRPSGPEEWVVARSYRIWQQEAQRFVGRWGGIARAADLPILPSDWEMARGELLRLGRLVERLYEFHDDLDVYRQFIGALFPYGIDADEVLHRGRCERLIEALRANLERADLVAAINLRSGLEALACDFRLPFYAAIRDFCANLGSPDVSQSAIADAWQEIVAEARRLNSSREQLGRLDEIVSKVAASGAPWWAAQLRRADPSVTVICGRRRCGELAGNGPAPTDICALSATGRC